MTPVEFQNVVIQWATTIVAVLIAVCGLLAKFLPIFAELRARIDALNTRANSHADDIRSLNEQTTMLATPMVAPAPPITAGTVKVPTGDLINTFKSPFTPIGTQPSSEYEKVAAKPDQGITN